MPDIELRPVGKREDTDALAVVNSTVVDIPEFRPLVLGFPLSERIAEGVDPLLGAGLFLIPPGSAECRVEAAGSQTVEQRPGFQEAAAFLGSQAEGIRPVFNGLGVGMDDQPGSDLGAESIP